MHAYLSNPICDLVADGMEKVLECRPSVLDWITTTLPGGLMPLESLYRAVAAHIADCTDRLDLAVSVFLCFRSFLAPAKQQDFLLQLEQYFQT